MFFFNDQAPTEIYTLPLHAALPISSGNYNLYFGDISGLSSYAYTGSACALGASGAATAPMPAGSVFFYVVGTDGAGTESANGWDSSGAAVSATGVGVACSITTQDIFAGCP